MIVFAVHSIWKTAKRKKKNEKKKEKKENRKKKTRSLYA